MGGLGLRAPAKINWSLEVLGRRADGFHEVDTVLQTVSLADELWFAPRPQPRCRIRCSAPAVPVGPANLIHKAWRALRRARPGRVAGLRVRLIKRIPVGAGLGGGSADAAATLRAINRLYRLGMSRVELATIAAEIGADVPFFLFGGVARCGGRGERVRLLPTALPHIPLVIVYPGFVSSTAEAYPRLQSGDWRNRAVGDRVERALRAGNAAALRRFAGNVFDRRLAEHDRRYAVIKTAMETAGLIRPRLCGSGSACYGWARDAAHGRRAAVALTRGPWRAFAVRTLRGGLRRLAGAERHRA